tara:strand:+ start:180 stop:740 length:561 start_codon:yes stop_codon:yes gene_type:complete
MNNKLEAKFNKFLSLIFLLIFLNQCGMGADARKYPPEPELRVKKNMEEGRGFRLMGGEKKGGDFEFASSNPLWKASLDTIDFMPLASANYSGGIIITDWYSSENSNESIKVSIRFLTNEVRSDALDIKVFYKKCALNENCAISEKSGKLVNELNKKILQKAAVYKKLYKDKNIRPYEPGIGEVSKN